jgi:transposase
VDVLGIDISKADFHGCLLQGERSSARSFPNSKVGYQQLRRWLKNRKAVEVHVCMEATGAYWLDLATDLFKQKLYVSVTNPAQIKSFARTQLRRTKTDKVDARIIADFCRTLSPGQWEPLAPEVLEIRALLSYREQLVGDRLRAKQLGATVAGAHVFAVQNEQRIADLGAMIKTVDSQLRALISNATKLEDAARRLQTIPGVGWLTAAVLIAHLPMDRLRNSRAAAAYAGLTPCFRESGTSVHGRPRLSKIGNAKLRRGIYMAALAAMRGNSPLAVFGKRLKDAGKCGKVATAAVMRKLVTVAYAVLKSGQTYNPALQA